MYKNMADQRSMLNKVPQITIFFWLIKILCTTVGETFADFISFNIGLGLLTTTILMGTALAAALFFQFRAKKYQPGIYWIAVVLLSVFGTLVTDNLTDNMGVPLELSTMVFSILLTLTLLLWYRSEKTLSIHSIYTTKREVYYWLTILFTFALGTAVGDLYSEQLGFGYFNTGAAVIIIIGLIYLLYRFAGLNGILAFWMAYILTRPLGASLGDFLSQPVKNGGLGLGTTITSIIFLAAILAIIIYLAVSKIDEANYDGEAQLSITRDTNRKVLFQTITVLLVTLVIGFSVYQIQSNQIQQTTQNTTLTDQLTGFLKIEDQIKKAADKHDAAGAKQGADQLEQQWDNKEPKLRAIDSKQWTKIDVTIDTVLSSVRTSQLNQAKIDTAVAQSEHTLNAANK